MESTNIVGKNIRDCRTAFGMTQQELADSVGYKSKTTINKIELGINDIPISKVVEIADVLGTTPSYLMGWEDDADEELLPVTRKRFPLLGEIACGEPIFCNEDRESYVMAGTDIKADFCLKARGDSMTGAKIDNGDIVFIKKADVVNNGDIAAVIIDNEVLLKRFYYDRESAILTLQSENSKYAPKVITGEKLKHVRVLGRAVALQCDL